MLTFEIIFTVVFVVLIIINFPRFSKVIENIQNELVDEYRKNNEKDNLKKDKKHKE